MVAVNTLPPANERAAGPREGGGSAAACCCHTGAYLCVELLVLLQHVDAELGQVDEVVQLLLRLALHRRRLAHVCNTRRRTHTAVTSSNRMLTRH